MEELNAKLPEFQNYYKLPPGSIFWHTIDSLPDEIVNLGRKEGSNVLKLLTTRADSTGAVYCLYYRVPQAATPEV